jgi:hypothetical protein
MGCLVLVGWRSTGGEQFGSATGKGPLIATCAFCDSILEMKLAAALSRLRTLKASNRRSLLVLECRLKGLFTSMKL